MSYSFSRDRTAELRDTSGNQTNTNGYSSEDDFGPQRRPLGGSVNNRNRAPAGSAAAANPPLQDNFSPQPVASSNWRNSPRQQEEQYEMQQPSTPSLPPTDLTTTNGFLEEVDRTQQDIDTINHKVDAIGNLHNTALESFNEQQSKQIAKDLDLLKAQTRQKNTIIKNQLIQLENSNVRLQANDPDAPMRKAQAAALRKRFMETIQRYQDVERNYQVKYRQRIERQIRIVKPEATSDEIDDIIDSDDTPQVFTQSLMNAGRQGQSKAVLSEVQTRHDDIKHIERTIVELHQLFMDMQMMVEQQGETLTTVEDHAVTTSNDLESGNKTLTRAIAIAKSTRTKKWCCFFLCIGICIMIAILVWWFAFGHVGVGGSSNSSNSNNNGNNNGTSSS